MKNKSSQIYPVIFILKRAAIALLLVSGETYEQVYGMMAIQLAYILYLQAYRPMYRSENRHEVYVEYTLLFMSYITLMYTGYIADSGLLRLLGFSEILVCVLLVFVKAVKIALTTLKAAWLWVKRLYSRCLARKGSQKQPHSAKSKLQRAAKGNKVDCSDSSYNYEDEDPKVMAGRGQVSRYQMVEIHSPEVRRPGMGTIHEEEDSDDGFGTHRGGMRMIDTIPAQVRDHAEMVHNMKQIQILGNNALLSSPTSNASTKLGRESTFELKPMSTDQSPW